MSWLILTALLLAVTYCIYWVAFYNPESRHHEAVVTRIGRHWRRGEALNREWEQLPYECVSITSRDGLRLSGRYYHVRDGACLHIQFHGYRGSGGRDFAAGNLVARELGYNTLVVDQRAHGNSQGNTMTFGIKERWDCLCWAEYAFQRFGENCYIFLSGISMGAATVLMASELSLPKNVVGIVADCPYSSPVAIVRKVCRDVHIPGFLSVPLGTASAWIWGHFDLCRSSAKKAVQRTQIPVLLIHGTEDKYIPSVMSKEIQENCAGECFLELFPGAAHAGSCLTDTRRYSRVLDAFVRHCIEKRKTEDST